MSDSRAGGGGGAQAAPSPDTARQYSSAQAVRFGLYGAGAGGAALLLAGAFLPVVSIRVAGVMREEQAGWDRHGPALVLLALAGAALLWAAWRGGSRPAMAAVGLVGLAAAVIALLFDLPDLGAVGAYGSRLRTGVAETGPGFYAETLGAVLLLVSGGGLLSLTPSSAKA